MTSKVSTMSKRYKINSLPSERTELAGCFFHPTMFVVFTVDVNSLVRMWCLRTGECLRSYPLE